MLRLLTGQISLALLVGAGCHSASAMNATLPQQIVISAHWHLEERPSLRRRDCSGLVRDILARVGLEVDGGSRHLYAKAKRDGRLVESPSPGDLAFFDRTYDANRNGKVDDELTHVAVVTDIHKDGTIEMVHYGSRKIRTLFMNLEHPSSRKLGKKMVNDFLRSPGYGGKSSPRLAGQLFRGFARPPLQQLASRSP